VRENTDGLKKADVMYDDGFVDRNSMDGGEFTGCRELIENAPNANI
jgi:hypothetical protein